MRIHQLTVSTNDVAGQALFYRETLGLPVHECAAGAFEVSLQASTIRFEQASPGTDPRYHFAINVPRGSIVSAAAWIADRHEPIAFHGDPDMEKGSTIVRTDRAAAALYFLDAGGNVVELIASDHLDNDSGAPVWLRFVVGDRGDRAISETARGGLRGHFPRMARST